MGKIKYYLRLLRPANILTAISDVLAGVALSTASSDAVGIGETDILWLCMATIGLYGGGIVFNDVFDAAIDRFERSERPIPSGKVSVRQAALFGSLFFVFGLLAACTVNVTAGMIAGFIVCAALLYNKWAKHHRLFGPLVMGLCRGANLLLGIAIVSHNLLVMGYIALVPIVYIAAITLISSGEVHGSRKSNTMIATGAYTLVIAAIGLFAYIHHSFAYTLSCLVVLVIVIYPPLFRAMLDTDAGNVGKAVKAGIIGLIVVNAAWAMASSAFVLTGIILLLLPLSICIARFFAVT